LPHAARSTGETYSGESTSLGLDRASFTPFVATVLVTLVRMETKSKGGGQAPAPEAPGSSGLGSVAALRFLTGDELGAGDGLPTELAAAGSAPERIA
jgi:hypothetical protein